MSDFPKLVNCHDDSVIPITNSTFSIGRSLSCDHIIQSLGVSRFHCNIKKTDNKWILYDRSTNGTLVNSTLYKFNESVELHYGDIIKLGPSNLDFIFSAPDSPAVGAEVTIEEAPILAAEFEKPFPEKVEPKNDVNDAMENELTCSICSELFIKAVTLNCSHTYCKYCIDEWRKTKSSCPICRKPIATVAATLVLDNFIEKFVNMQSDQVKESRKDLVRHREELSQNTAGSSNANEVIQIYSDTEDQDEDNFTDYSDQDFDYDYDDYDEPRYDSGGYYGGYGRCYICSQRGHWANSCPHKRH